MLFPTGNAHLPALLGLLLVVGCRNGNVKQLPIHLHEDACAGGVDNNKIRLVSVGSDSACAVTCSGAIKCWGRNSCGQLGDGTTTDRTVPVEVQNPGSGVKAIAVGGGYACAVSSAGGVRCWGAQGCMFGDRGVSPLPTDIVGLESGVTAIAIGEEHTCVLLNVGVKCWNNTEDDEEPIGDGSTTQAYLSPVDEPGLGPGVIDIDAWGTSCAVTSTGGVKCWGNNMSGQVGNGESALAVPTPVDVIGLGSGVSRIGVSHSFVCALTDAGTVKCWGNNQAGSLGDGTTESHFTPVDVVGLSGVAAMDVGTSTCVIGAEGGLKCWGANFWGTLGDGTTTDRSTPGDVVGLASGVTAISSGWGQVCAITGAGVLKCWGRSFWGEKGTNTLTPVEVEMKP